MPEPLVENMEIINDQLGHSDHPRALNDNSNSYDTWIEMPSDNCRLSARIWKPMGNGEKFPAILEYDANWASLPLKIVDSELISKNDTLFKFHLDRYKYPNRYPNANALEHREAAADILREIEVTLKNNWLGGSQPNFTDIAILPFIRQFRGVDAQWFDNLKDIPKVILWTNRFLDWEGFKSVMIKYPKWKPGDSVTTFGVTSL